MSTSTEVDPDVLPGEDTVRVTEYFCPAIMLFLFIVTVPEVEAVTSEQALGDVLPEVMEQVQA